MTRQHKEEKAEKEKEDMGHRQTRQHKKQEKAVKEKENEGHRQTKTAQGREGSEGERG